MFYMLCFSFSLGHATIFHASHTFIIELAFLFHPLTFSLSFPCRSSIFLHFFFHNSLNVAFFRPACKRTRKLPRSIQWSLYDATAGTLVHVAKYTFCVDRFVSTCFGDLLGIPLNTRSEDTAKIATNPKKNMHNAHRNLVKNKVHEKNSYVQIE